MNVAILGLDGATWDLLDPIMAAGHMPRLAALVEQGARARLTSTTPPVTALAWPSFYTGQNAGKHGVFSFVRQDEQGRPRVVDALAVRAPALWDWVSAAGLRVGVMGVPVTYPARPVNGFLISGFLSPSPANASHPPDLLDELTARHGAWTFHIPPIEPRAPLEAIRDFASRLMHDAERRMFALETLLDEFDPHLLISVWMQPDTIQHAFWGCLHPAHPLYSSERGRAVRDALHPVYRQLDEIIAMLARRVLPHGALLLMSDHGFGPLNRRIALNNILAELGRLRLRGLPLFLSRVRRRAGRKLSGRLGESDWTRHIQRNPDLTNIIDWSRTVAFAGAAHEMCVHINRRDRFAHGIVPPEQVEPLCTAIAQQLLALRDDEGNPLIKRASRAAELYHGPHVHLAPDLFLEPADDRDIFTDGLLRGQRRWREEGSIGRGWHRRDGVFLAIGQRIRRPSSWTAQPSLLDLAPTTLHLLGYEPPAEMDGRTLTEMLTPDDRPRSAPPAPSGFDPGPTALSDEEDARLVERLRGLGYLD
ncbi:MAG: hypothetical protein GXP42_05980 [Chloroflexi bacterium]|nr:hypothetical protein [Chloroflexota bacterium]